MAGPPVWLVFSGLWGTVSLVQVFSVVVVRTLCQAVDHHAGPSLELPRD